MFRYLTLLIIPMSVLMLSGCGESGPQIVEVEGTVTMGGKPLEKIYVEFYPEKEGPQSTGITDASGRFVLQTKDGKQKGAPVGSHKVVIQDMSIMNTTFMGRAGEEVDLREGRKPRTAEKYTNPMMTPARVEITGASKDVEIRVDPYVETAQ